MKKSRVINRSTTLSPIIRGVVLSFILLLISSFIVSLILSGFKNPIERLGIGSLIAFMLSGALSGFIIAKRNKGSGFKTALISSVIFIAVVFLSSLLSEGGSISGKAFMNYLCYLMISAFSAFVGAREKSRHRRH